MTALAPRHATLAQWLDWQLAQHSQEIQLGLERVQRVAQALGLLPLTMPSVVVAGTNGKGSTAALVAGLIGSRGSVGVYSSPHIWRYNERVAINGQPSSDAALVEAFEAIDDARDGVPLTYFEFGTLAALWLFVQQDVDYAVLEVGLGGRLDAVNIVDADVALITQIGLDHCDWLGPDRESIGFEKAGILRGDQPAYCADRDCPQSIVDHARRVGARLSCIGSDFDIRAQHDRWQYQQGSGVLDIAPHAAVITENLALAMAGVRDGLGLSIQADDVARACTQQARLVGRRELVDAPIPIIYDVGHNVEAIGALVEMLERKPVTGKTHVVIGMLADKPIEAVGQRLAGVADRLYPVGLDTQNARGLDAAAMAARLGCAAGFADPQAGLQAARAAARIGDRIVVCGSFFTVAQARRPDDE